MRLISHFLPIKSIFTYKSTPMLLKIFHSITPLFLYIKLYHKFPVFSIMRMENHQYAQEKISCLFITAKPLYLSYAKANCFRSIRHINSLKTPLQAQFFGEGG